jgi:poly(A) polymerase
MTRFPDHHGAAGILRTVGRIGADLGIDVYAVGGIVRDALLGRDTNDIDFVTLGPDSGVQLAGEVARVMGGTTAHVYPNFGTAAVRLDSGELEFVGARRESYRRTSRKPIVEEGTLEDDLRRRDFTVNAMAANVHPGRFGEIVDPFDGRRDLESRILRTPLDPERTFEDDPLRIVRAARFAAQLEFEVAPEALEAMRARAHRVEILSQERVSDELQKMICARLPSTGFRILYETGVLEHLLPELAALQGVEAVDGHRHKDNFYHTLQVLDNAVAAVADRSCDDTRALRWAALLHDIGKTQSKRFVKGTGWTFHGHEERGARMVPDIFRRLKLPLDERMENVRELVRLHHRPVALVDDAVTDSAVRRLLFDAGDLIDDLMALVRADITSKNPRRVRRYLGAFDRVEAKMVEVEEKDHLRHFQPPVDGHEIMNELGISEGLAVGLVKEAIREAILEGEIPNEHDAAYAYMMRIKDDMLRRGRLFDEVVRSMQPGERRAVGAVKEHVQTQRLPPDDAAAIAELHRVKREALAPREGDAESVRS